MPKFPMDLSKFEKISTSDKKTTMKHKDGHFIVIAHNKIKPELKSSLDALPFAKGGKVKPKKDTGYKCANCKRMIDPEELPTHRCDQPAGTFADGGEVADPDPQKAKQMQAGATQSGWQPKTWAANIKTGLGMADGGQVEKKQPATSDGKAPNTFVGPPKPDQPKADEATNPQDFMNRAHQEFTRTGYAQGGQIDQNAEIERIRKEAARYGMDLAPTRMMKDGGRPEEAPLEIEKIEEIAPAQTPKADLSFSEADAEPSIDGKAPPEAPMPADQPLQADTPPNPQAPMQSSSPNSQPQVEAIEPETPAEQAPKAAKPQTPAQEAPEPTVSQEILNERNNTAQDIMEGHIHPKTYQELFDNKGTLGKIGTIFGLLAGGIGSGMTGQPNALLQMMDKMIDRDLDAQKTSASNRQNFYKIRQQQALNNAVIKRYQVENGLTRAQAEEAFAKAGMSRIDLMQMAKSLGINPAMIDAHAKTLAKMDMHSAILHDADLRNQKLPPGPLKAAGDQALKAAANKAFNEDHPAMAAKVEQAQNADDAERQNKEDSESQQIKDANHILGPDAENKFQAAQYSALFRKNPALAHELEEQYQAADQADRATDAIVDSFNKLKKLRSWGTRAYGSVSPGALGALGVGAGAALGGTKGAEAGGGIGAAIGHLVPTTSNVRAYEAEKAKLQGLIGNALSAAKLTPTEVTHMIDKYAPIQGDEPSTDDTKLKGILDKVKLAVKRTRLKAAKMTKD